MFEFELPDLGEGVTEGELLAWHVAPGDAVAADDVVAEVETDKAAVDVPAPVDGTVRELHAEAGDVVAVGDVIASIEEGDVAETPATAEEAEGADATEETATAETEVTGEAVQSAKGGRVFAPPNVRRLARELGVDVASVAGSGPSGRVSETDVRAAAEDDESDDAETGESELKSAVRRVGDLTGSEESEAVEADDVETADAETDDGEPELKSAVRRVGDGEEDAAAEAEDTGTDDAGADGTDDDETDESGTNDAKTRLKSAFRRVRDAEADETAGEDESAEAADGDGVETDDGEEDAAAEADETEEKDGEEDGTEVTSVVSRVSPDEGEPGDDAGERTDGADAQTDDAGVETAEEGTQESERPARQDASNDDASRPTRREPYEGARRTIGEQMRRSHREIPQVTHHDLAEVEALVEARERLKPLAEERGVDLTYLPFVLKSVAAALRDHPILNAELDEDAGEILYREYYDVGVAVATDDGLVVPVVRDVDDKRILEVAAEVNDLVERAHAGDLDPAETRDATFTVTNFGAIGGEFATPVVTPGQTATLGVGELRERAVAENGEVVAERTLPLSVSIDHRVANGGEAAHFVDAVADYLADPTLLLLE